MRKLLFTSLQCGYGKHQVEAYESDLHIGRSPTVSACRFSPGEYPDATFKTHKKMITDKSSNVSLQSPVV